MQASTKKHANLPAKSNILLNVTSTYTKLHWNSDAPFQKTCLEIFLRLATLFMEIMDLLHNHSQKRTTLKNDNLSTTVQKKTSFSEKAQQPSYCPSLPCHRLFVGHDVGTIQRGICCTKQWTATLTGVAPGITQWGAKLCAGGRGSNLKLWQRQ